jgi:glycine/D-amino acid oxidase-like deaminating enzyme
MSKFGIEFLKNPSLLQLPNESDVPDFQFRENGYLFLASSAEGQGMLKKNNALQREVGVTWTELMDPTALKAKFPWLNVEDIVGGSLGLKNEGCFDPWSLLTALKGKVRHQRTSFPNFLLLFPCAWLLFTK